MAGTLARLGIPEARTNLVALHDEFWPQYVISSSWSNYLSEGQMREVFKRSGLAFVADNMHRRWTTPKAQGPSRTKVMTSIVARVCSNRCLTSRISWSCVNRGLDLLLRNWQRPR